MTRALVLQHAYITMAPPTTEESDIPVLPNFGTVVNATTE
ncbi:hypothetical protein M7I_1584 [Glarea lozoyensis 74030]|uniref:Uncharacterized protein n=1 Tax=Glarea lozoyensis (strain ATCC 74030 / MF5533) TaxID=1104152 RepID=H0EGG8_GLAL7|nr:hypothetical protein M7I_1584 [Glarea lozoyensis 74030]